MTNLVLAAAAAACCVAVAQPSLQIPGSGTVRGIVLDKPNGAPVGRVGVRIETAGKSAAATLTALTDDGGRFEIEGVPAGHVELSVSAVDFVLVKRPMEIKAGAVVELTIVLSESTGRFAETVTVVGAPAPRNDPATPAGQTLRGHELQQLSGVLANDPMRAVQTLPGVVANDDLRSEFSIRGAGIDRTSFVFEGISTDFLLHKSEVLNGASIAMVNGDVIDTVNVANGSYAQAHGNRIGGQVDFQMRDGSRDQVKTQAAVSLIDSSATVEGPIGASHRGSWLAAARVSYLDLFARQLYPNPGDSFGFSDEQVKAAYDINPRQQLQFALTAGRSHFNQDPAHISPTRNAEGGIQVSATTSHAAVGVLSWRYQPSPRWSLTERVAADVDVFENTADDGSQQTGDAHDVIARTEWTFVPRGSVAFDGGGEMRRTSASERQHAPPLTLPSGITVAPALDELFSASTVGVSAFAKARLSVGAGNITPGMRIDHWSLTTHTIVSPWMEGLLPLSSALTLRAGGGIYRQEPSLVALQGFAGDPTLAPERAFHADVGVEGRVSSTITWRATAYNREDRGLIEAPNLDLRVRGTHLGLASDTSQYANALDGYARGIELTLERRTPNGLSGWISYALGFNHYHDSTTGDSFWGDLDQRHTINAYGSYRKSDRLSFSARFRAGSNTPATGYWTERDGADFVGDTRNTLRVPFYSRLDARMNRTFAWKDRRLTVFVEALNVYNRANVRFATPAVDSRTFQTSPLFDPLLPLVPSIGAKLEF